MPLADVFVISESVGNITRILGYPPEVADIFASIDRKFAFTLASLYRKDMLKYLSEMSQSDRDALGITDTKSAIRWIMGGMDLRDRVREWLDPEKFNGDRAAGYRILMKLREDPNLEKKISNANTSYEALQTIAKIQHNKDKHVGREITKFADGFYWVELNCRDEFEEEGDLMQHCGQASGKVFSLRDAQGYPHVTIDAQLVQAVYSGKIYWEITQIRGKQNAKPDKKYDGYIIPLLRNYFGAGAHGAKLPPLITDDDYSTSNAEISHAFMNADGRRT